MFVNELKNEMNKKLQETENGALGYAKTQSALVDFNFRISSYRNMSEEAIFSDFMKAYNENEILAMRMLFYLRDVRGGLGERRLFRVILKNLEKGEPKMVEKVLHLVAMFGRWDDIFELMGTSLESPALKIVAKQLFEDVKNKNANKPVSLLAKWMPSINCSNKERRRMAEKIAKTLGLSPRIYRKTLSGLRAYLEVIEQKMSAGKWEDIDYSAVPSRANLIYNKTFLKHDEGRRREFLNSVEKGEATINSGVNFPYNILAKYNAQKSVDQGVEALWKALPDFGQLENTLVVADGSGSMSATIGKTNLTALDVANSLAIYFAERCEGGFKNHYITFSERPQLVDLGEGSLFSKKRIAEQHCEIANTNIEAVFKLILQTAVKRKMKQEELPGTILILSDMEFDSCTSSTHSWYRRDPVNFSTPDATLFASLAAEYAVHGYKLPKLAFWNILSRTMTVPVQENEAGVVLVSGFSPSAIKMVLSGKANPYEALIEVLKDNKYDIVEEAIS